MLLIEIGEGRSFGMPYAIAVHLEDRHRLRQSTEGRQQRFWWAPWRTASDSKDSSYNVLNSTSKIITSNQGGLGISVGPPEKDEVSF